MGSSLLLSFFLSGSKLSCISDEAYTRVWFLLYLWPFAQQCTPWNSMFQTITVDIWSVIGSVGQSLATTTGLVNDLHCFRPLLYLKPRFLSRFPFPLAVFSRSHAVSNPSATPRDLVVFVSNLNPDLRFLICKEACRTRMFIGWFAGSSELLSLVNARGLR